MSNEYVSRLRIAGDEEAIRAFVSDHRAGDDHLTLGETFLETLAMSEDDVNLVAETDEPETSTSNGLGVVEYTVVTRRGAPWDLAERLSTRKGFVVSLASVEPGNRYADVRVYGHGQEWRYEMLDSDYDRVERKCERTEQDVAGRLLDVLQSDSASVVDDYEVAMSAPTLDM